MYQIIFQNTKKKKSLRPEVRQKSDISECKIFFILQFFPKKEKRIFRQPVKNCFGSTLNHFLGKEGGLPQKLT